MKTTWLRSDPVPAQKPVVALKPLALIGSARAGDSRSLVEGLHGPGIPDNDV
jgi:hypothetical protein